MKQTFQPSNLHRKRTHGFRARMKTKAGRAILSGEFSRSSADSRGVDEPLIRWTRSMVSLLSLRVDEFTNQNYRVDLFHLRSSFGS